MKQTSDRKLLNCMKIACKRLPQFWQILANTTCLEFLSNLTSPPLSNQQDAFASHRTCTCFYLGAFKKAQ